MSVIAWDGQRLAADKRATLGTLIRTTTKVFHLGDALAAYAGDADAGEELLAWFKDGRDAAKFPASQRDKDTWAGLLIVWQDGAIWKYERTPHPLKFPPQHFAIGSGRDFALAAMHCGKTAPEAVEVACVFDSGCGNGVDVLTHNAELTGRPARQPQEYLMSTEDTTTTAAAGPVERPVRLDPERAWLVEWRFNGTQWLYLTGGSFNFTADPNRALRLARRADAEAAMQWAIEFDRRLGLRPTGELLVTEHEWPNDELTG